MVFGTSQQIASQHRRLATNDPDEEKDIELSKESTASSSTAKPWDPVKEKETKSLKMQKLPGYSNEVLFIMVTMFIFKFYNERFFEAMTFFLLSCPFLVYIVGTLFINLMEFIKLLHIEEMSGSLTEEESQELVSP